MASIRARGTIAPKANAPNTAFSAFDEFGLMFNGNKSIEIEQQQQDEGRREEEGDGAPPRTRIDLASGTARIVILPAGGPTGPRSAAPSGAGGESESGRGQGPEEESPA
ncbi:DUF6191 domain-containing protein [Streptomyces mirabilis]|uniref:DUF6191 domain-containing protein n=1 Tax=Streptomyces mirabilis TaxID=68239 RepID=UPI00324785FC